MFRAKKELSAALLPFIVNNDKFFDYAVKHSAGGLSPRVKFKDLANYEFLLPPKAEQARLADLLWAMDDVIEKEKGVLERRWGFTSALDEISEENPINDDGANAAGCNSQFEVCAVELLPQPCASENRISDFNYDGS